MRALPADGAVGMPTARGEIIGAYHDRASDDLTPSADVVGGCEARDATLLIIFCETCEAADLAKAAGIEEQIDPLSTGQLAAVALADDSGINRVGREAAMRDILQRLNVGQHGSRGVL